MKIVSNDLLSTKLTSEGDDYGLAQSQVLFRGAATDAILVGSILELCVSVGEVYVVFMSDNIPSEDMLRIYLLDKNAHVIESATIGAPYTTGSFRLLELITPNVITFNFIGETIWVLRILNKTKLHMPFFSDPKGVSRKLCFSTKLELEGNPVPETRK